MRLAIIVAQNALLKLPSVPFRCLLVLVIAVSRKICLYFVFKVVTFTTYVTNLHKKVVTPRVTVKFFGHVTSVFNV